MADTPITSVTSPHPCGKPSPVSIRIWAYKSPPALRAIRPDSSSEQTSSGKGGDGLLQLEGDLTARIPVRDTPSSLNDGADSHATESPAYAGENIPKCLKKTSRN